MDYHFLAKTVLFRGCSPEEIEAMLACLHPVERTYRRGEVILHAGDTAVQVGLVLSGSGSIESDDVWGNRSILDQVTAGQLFAETYACLPGEVLMVSVTAAENCRVLLRDMNRVLHVCGSTCAHHTKLIRNLLSVTAQKNLNLSRRIFHTAAKSIRGRLLSYLSFCSVQHGSREFDIPFSRQQLADYLGVDRSALSNELSKMQRDGLIRYERNHFLLTGQSPEELL